MENKLENRIELKNRLIEKAVKKYTREVKLKIFPAIKNNLNGQNRRK